jgi:hypothetical protein
MCYRSGTGMVPDHRNDSHEVCDKTSRRKKSALIFSHSPISFRMFCHLPIEHTAIWHDANKLRHKKFYFEQNICNSTGCSNYDVTHIFVSAKWESIDQSTDYSKLTQRLIRCFVCLAIGPWSLTKRVLQRSRFSASSSRFQHHVMISSNKILTYSHGEVLSTTPTSFNDTRTYRGI